MSGFFGDAEASEAEKLKRAGTTGRTILAALPKDRYGGIDRPADIVDRRFPQKHEEMHTPAGIVDERFPKEDEIKGITFDPRKLPEMIEEFKRRHEEEELRRARERRLRFDPRPLGRAPGTFDPY
ncbi:MAG: hypothetical protein K2Y27_34965 [Xanthobacteraceae bacterium]|nr:hypothetical protein [Xanthobacteraceae bacterium]